MESKIINLNPKPEKYEAYECTLSDNLQKIAKDELREDENVRNQALAQLREWIAKHPKITLCRTDAPFLLSFLRARKFSMLRTYELLENFLSTGFRQPEFVHNLDIEDPSLSEAYDTGMGFFLKERDAKGRIVTFTTLSRFDFAKLTPYEFCRLICSNAIFCSSDEITQVIGTVNVADFKGLTIKWPAAVPLTLMKKSADCVNKALPLRIKEFHVFNIPAVTIPFFNAVLSFFSEKIQKRVHFYKSLEEMAPFVDIKILPKEYGGTIPMDEMIACHKKSLRAYRHELLENVKMFNDVKTSFDEYDTELDGGTVGSFRKLEID